ncbi:YggT family protein [Paludibacterium paludis]|uniref:Membrane protein n=1 Tax=Paludibacterium paludis TaxID=1225769 RepID=A0A918P1I1_9NEIS|nr:YggT family protein [Paludibacterium paludis]GGY12268.1 membrane protein [Paludibacterium paludis]
MFYETLQFLLRTVSDLFVLVLLLRFYLQVARAPFKHPVCQFVLAVTNFAVIPARRLIPSLRGYDAATLAVGWGVSMVSSILIMALNPIAYDFTSPQTWVALALLALLYLFKQSLNLLMGAVIVQAVMSWVNPYNPLTPILDSLTRPYLRHFGFARVGSVDLAPLVLFLVIQVILMLPVRFLESAFLMQLKVLM